MPPSGLGHRELRPPDEHAADMDYLPTSSTMEYDANIAETDRTHTGRVTDDSNDDSRQTLLELHAPDGIRRTLINADANRFSADYAGLHDYTENKSSLLNNDTEHSAHSNVSVIAVTASSADSEHETIAAADDGATDLDLDKDDYEITPHTTHRQQACKHN